MGGRLCDTFSVKFTAYIGHYLFIMNCILSIIVSLLDLFPLSCVACFFWGYLVYYTQANEMVICSKLFKGKSESFSVMKQFHACSLIIYEVISMLTHNSIPVGFLMSGALLFAFPSLYLINKLS